MTNRFLEPFIYDMNQTNAVYKISSLSKNAIIFLPIIIVLLSFMFLIIDETRSPMLWMLQENHPVEVFTFLALMSGGLCGLTLALRLKQQVESLWIVSFYTFFSLGLIFVGMEEVAWGQSFLNFETPQMIKSINLQQEVTLHNIKGLQGHSEVLRLVFGLGGLIGVMASYLPGVQKIGAPAILLPWFLVITLHAALDVYDDTFPLGSIFNFLMQRTSEVVELLIGVGGLLYVWLNFRRMSPMG